MAENNFSQELLRHRYIAIAAGLIVIIALGAVAYYYLGMRRPAPVSLPNGSATQGDVIANGTVAPAENPNLSFQNGGRVASVNVAVGDRVYGGQTLASLDISTLSAQRAQAQANLAAQEAHLASLKAGPRSTDVAVKQAGVNQAMQTKIAAYADVPSAISDAYAKGNDAVRTTADALFSNPTSPNPTLIFSASNSNAVSAAVSGRVAVGGELAAWQTELSALSATPTPSDLDGALSNAVQHLIVVRNFEDSLILALDAAIPTSSFPSSSVAAAQASVSAARTAVNALVTSLTDKKQTLVSDELAIENAEAALNQLNAGASTEDVAAQQAAVDQASAAVQAVNAQIAQDLIIAPFTGAVGSVAIKPGDAVTPNAPVVTLLPDSPLEIDVTVSEVDVTKLTAGDAADITLDAYGSGKVFPGHVTEVDTAPTMVNGVSAYEVKLSFDSPDASIKTGMTANAVIHPNTNTH